MKAKLSVLITLSIFLHVTYVYSQTGKPLRNNFYLELGGAAILYSFNYEFFLLKNEKRNIAPRIGVMLFPYSQNSTRRFIAGVPIGISYLKMIDKNSFEFGLTAAAIKDDTYFDNYSIISELITIYSVRTGVRRQPNKKGVFWNALVQMSGLLYDDYTNFSPSIHSTYYQPWISIGIGKSW